MIRALGFLLLVLAIALPSPVSADALAQPSDVKEKTMLTGVVLHQGRLYVPDRWRKAYYLEVTFLAWREGDGSVDTTQLSVTFITKNRAEMDTIREQVHNNATVRFTIDGPLRIREDAMFGRTVEARYAANLETVADAALSAAAERVRAPAPLEDPLLGTFEPDPANFVIMRQTRDWFGRAVPFELILEPLGPQAAPRALAMARLAWQERDAIDAAIREYVSNAIYAPRARTVQVAIAGDGEPAINAASDPFQLPPLKREAFRADHSLVKVACGAQNFCVFFYAPNRAEGWGYRATIERDGDGDSDGESDGEGDGWYVYGFDDL